MLAKEDDKVVVIDGTRAVMSRVRVEPIIDNAALLLKVI